MVSIPRIGKELTRVFQEDAQAHNKPVSQQVLLLMNPYENVV